MVEVNLFPETFTSQEAVILEYELADLFNKGTDGKHCRLCRLVRRRAAGDSVPGTPTHRAGGRLGLACGPHSLQIPGPGEQSRLILR